MSSWGDREKGREVMATVVSEWISPLDIQPGTVIAYTVLGATMTVTGVTAVESVRAVRIDGIRTADGVEIEWFVPDSTRFAI